MTSKFIKKSNYILKNVKVLLLGIYYEWNKYLKEILLTLLQNYISISIPVPVLRGWSYSATFEIVC